MTRQNTHTLTYLLDMIDKAADQSVVTIRDVLDEMGDRSILPFILVISLLLVSPMSGIPGVPTLCATLIVLLAAQAISGKRRLWLPNILLRRAVKGKRVRSAVSWLRRPSRFVDRHSRMRLEWLTVGPMRWMTLVVFVVLPLSWPALELLPFVSSYGAATVALLCFGLFTRDGVFVLLGYCSIALSFVVALAILD